LVKSRSRSFGQKQQDLSSKATRAMTLEEGKVRIENFMAVTSGSGRCR